METKQRHDHTNLFRRGIEKESGTRRREETSVRIRKQRREAHMRKRRMKPTSPVLPSALNVDINLLYTGNDDQKLNTLTLVRKMLSSDDFPPIAKVVEANLLPVFVQFLYRTDNHRMQFEAAWALTNVASGESEYTKAVIDANAIPPLIALLDSPHEDVKEQAVWVLGNISGDCIEYRDLVTRHNIVGAILRNFKPREQRISMIQNMTWTLSNVCRGKPAPPLEVVQPFLPALAWLIQHPDEDIISDACWALCYITDGDNERVDEVIKTGVCMRLVELMNHPCGNVQTPAVRTIGNMVTGSDHATQVVVDSGAIPILRGLLEHPKRNIKKESAWALSNINAGTQEQIQRVIDSKAIPVLMNMIATEEFSIKKELVWAISNATSGGSESQIEYLVQTGAITGLTTMVDCHDVKIITVILEAFENILKAGQKDCINRGLPCNPYTEIMEQAGALEKLEDLQDHDNVQVYNRAVRILERFFSAEEVTNEITQPTVFDFATGFQ